MISTRKNKDGSVTHGVRVYRGSRKFEWIGSFRSADYPTKRAAHNAAKAAEADALRDQRRRSRMTVDQYAERYLAEYERSHKRSSHDTAKTSLRRFRQDFGHRYLDTITRIDAKDWTAKVPRSVVPIVVTLLNQAVEDELIDRNPFRGLGKRTKGRVDQRPPTEAEMEKLLTACSVLGDYAPKMRALVRFASGTAMRPGELFALEWTDVDFDRMRVDVARRLYRGDVDTPKSNHGRLIALTPPARDALLALPRTSQYVFTSKTGKRLSQPTLSNYWRQVTARAKLDFDFYLACRHYCAHCMLVKLGLPRAVVKEQMGHADDKLLDLYGHENIGALERIDAAYETAEIVPIRGLRDAGETQGA